jgi:hypothetical protein
MALINKLEAVGDAIRAKTGKTDLLTLDEMVTEIAAIETGGGGGDLPEEALLITGECCYKFAYDGWNWFINKYGDKVTTKDIITPTYMFYFNPTLEYIPFEINVTGVLMNQMFEKNYMLKEVPKVNTNFSKTTGEVDLNGMFADCRCLREIPNDFFWNLGDKDFWDKQRAGKGNRQNIFKGCYSLRKLPDISMLISAETSAYSHLYYYISHYNLALDENTNIPVDEDVEMTSDLFKYSFQYASRLKRMTFETNVDGTPKTAKWKSQTIKLDNYVGFIYTLYEDELVNNNSGITEATRVVTDADYQALKDNEDMWTSNRAYSRYNHDSAVETINSLPDTSAYLASAGGTNTIQFQGDSGSKTDGGAINTMTAEEIAVAAAKGWTVTFK